VLRFALRRLAAFCWSVAIAAVTLARHRAQTLCRLFLSR
jgi:hypothetical protein